MVSRDKVDRFIHNAILIFSSIKFVWKEDLTRLNVAFAILVDRSTVHIRELLKLMELIKIVY